MAIDTLSKRVSACVMFTPTPSIIPDGTLDQGDRQHAVFIYSGISANAPVPYVSPNRTGLQVKDIRLVNHYR